MPNLEITKCALLRSKKEQYAELPNPDFAPDHFSPPQKYWCLQTMTDFGPDEQEVCLEACQGGRTCYQKVISIASDPIELNKKP